MTTSTSTASRAAHAAPNQMMSWRRGSRACGSEGGGSNGALANGSADGVGGLTGGVGCAQGAAESRSMTAVGSGSGSGPGSGSAVGSGVGSGSGVTSGSFSGSGARCAPTRSPAGRRGTTVVGSSLPGDSAGAVGAVGSGVAGDRCSVHADPSQYRWPPEPSGSGYQPAGVGGVVIAGG